MSREKEPCYGVWRNRKC